MASQFGKKSGIMDMLTGGAAAGADKQSGNGVGNKVLKLTADA